MKDITIIDETITSGLYAIYAEHWRQNLKHSYGEYPQEPTVKEVKKKRKDFWNELPKSKRRKSK